MNRVIKVLCLFLVSYAPWAMTDSHALHDKIAVVVNKHVLTEGEIDKYVSVYTYLSNTKQYINDPEFRGYIVAGIVEHYMLVDFAERAGLQLAPEEVVSAITQFMENQDLTYDGFQEYTESLGMDADALKEIISAGYLRQKVGMAAIRPTIEVTEDELVHARHQFIDDNALYKIKSWTADLDSMNMDSVKGVKKLWAESGVDPKVGEVMDLGWKKRSELPELFLKAIEGVSPGNLVGPVQSPFGYHLIWFEGEKMPDMPNDDLLKEGIFRHKYDIKFAEWLKDMKQYNIVIYK